MTWLLIIVAFTAGLGVGRALALNARAWRSREGAPVLDQKGDFRPAYPVVEEYPEGPGPGPFHRN